MTDFTPKFYPRELHFSLNKWIGVNPHNEGMHAHPSGAAVCCCGPRNFGVKGRVLLTITAQLFTYQGKG